MTDDFPKMIIDHTSIHKLKLRRGILSIGLKTSFVNQHLILFIATKVSESNSKQDSFLQFKEKRLQCNWISNWHSRTWMESLEKSWLTVRLKPGLYQNVLTSWTTENIRCSGLFVFLLETLSLIYIMPELSFSIKNILFGATKKDYRRSHFCPLLLSCPWGPVSRIQLCPSSSSRPRNMKKVKRSVFSKYQVDQLEKIFQKQVRIFCA